MTEHQYQQPADDAGHPVICEGYLALAGEVATVEDRVVTVGLFNRQTDAQKECDSFKGQFAWFAILHCWLLMIPTEELKPGKTCHFAVISKDLKKHSGTCDLKALLDHREGREYTSYDILTQIYPPFSKIPDVDIFSKEDACVFLAGFLDTDAQHLAGVCGFKLVLNLPTLH